MASSAVEESQLLQDKSEPQSGTSKEEEEDIKAVFASGLRVMMGSFLLDRLLMALSISIIKSNTSKFGVLNCEKVKSDLEDAMKKYSPYDNLITMQDQLLSMLGKLDFYQNAKSETQKGKFHYEIIRNIRDVDKFRCAAYAKSVLLDDAFSYAQDKKNSNIEKACLKLKIGYIHEICSSLKIGWKIFLDVDKNPRVFTEVSRLKDAEGKPLDGYQLIELLHKCRNDAAHHHDLDKGEGDIEEFQQQFDAVVDLLKPNFNDTSSQTNVKHYFPKVTTVFTDDMLNTRLRSCRETLLEVLKRNSPKEPDVVSLQKKKNNQIWSVIVAYHNRNQDMAKDVAVYHQLFGLIENPEQFSPPLGEDDSEPRADLESLVKERKLGKNSCHDPLTPTVVGDEEAENRDVTSGTAQPADIDVEEKDAEKEVVE